MNQDQLVEVEAVRSDQRPRRGRTKKPATPAAPPAQDLSPLAKWEEGGLRDPRQHPCCAPFEIVDAKAGVLRDPRKRKKLALVGFSSSSRHLAPYDDPEWAIAGLNQLYRYTPRADLWFEVHDPKVFLADQVQGTDYLAWLQQAPYPVVMQQVYNEIPQSVRFPVERAITWLGRDYFESSVAYMVAWAGLMGYKHLGIWGIDLVIGQEWDYQKPNLEYCLGVAHAHGMTFTIPEQSAVLKGRGLSAARYGTEDKDRTFGPFSRKWFDTIIKTGSEKREKLITDLNNVDGALAALGNMRDALTVYERGGEIKLPE
jgi:hypothetical protein